MIAQRFVVTKSSSSLCMSARAFQEVLTLSMLQLQSLRPLSSTTAKNVLRKENTNEKTQT